MSTDNDVPPAWQVALERYRDGYGGEPDFDDRTDRWLFTQLLEEQIRHQITRKIVESFRAATAQIEASTRALDEDRRHRERQP